MLLYRFKVSAERECWILEVSGSRNPSHVSVVLRGPLRIKVGFLLRSLG